MVLLPQQKREREREMLRFDWQTMRPSFSQTSRQQIHSKNSFRCFDCNQNSIQFKKLIRLSQINSANRMA